MSDFQTRTLQFLGGTGTVTGPKYLIRAGNRRVLVDGVVEGRTHSTRRGDWPPARRGTRPRLRNGNHPSGPVAERTADSRTYVSCSMAYVERFDADSRMYVAKSNTERNLLTRAEEGGHERTVTAATDVENRELE